MSNSKTIKYQQYDYPSKICTKMTMDKMSEWIRESI